MDYHTGIPELDEGLDARFDILSPTMRHLLKGDAVPILASALAGRHQLTEDMQSGMENEIALILMHLEPVDDFAANLMIEHLVPPEAALEIEKEITQKLFAPLMNELGHSDELETADAPLTPVASVEPASSPVLTQTPPAVAVPNPIPALHAPHVPVARVMPHSKAEAERDPRTSTELPNALLQNLKASLMHNVPEEPLEGTNPAPSYNAILNPKTPTPPSTPPNS